MTLHSDPTHAGRVGRLPAGVREFWARARKRLDATHDAMCEVLLETCEAMAHCYPQDIAEEDKAVLLALDRFVRSRPPKAA